MSKRLLFALAASLTLAGAPRAAEPLSLDWSVRPAADDGQVRLALAAATARGNDNTTLSLPLSDLQGLTRDQFASAAGARVTFRLTREAGRLDCDGLMRDRSGVGQCRFTPDAAFAAALERRGVAKPDAREQLQLALHGVGLAVLAELDRQGYARPSVHDLIAAGIFKIDVAFLRSLDAVGYRAGSVEKLVSMRIFKVDAARIGGFAAIGPRFRNLPPETLVAMSIHRVSPEYVKEMAQAGYAGLTPDQLIAMRIHGVTGAMARGANAAVRAGR